MEKPCIECGEIHEVCPECESRFFTPDDNPGEPPIKRFVHDADSGETRIIREVCWECGYDRERKVTVEDL